MGFQSGTAFFYFPPCRILPLAFSLEIFSNIRSYYFVLRSFSRSAVQGKRTQVHFIEKKGVDFGSVFLVKLLILTKMLQPVSISIYRS